MLSDILQKIPVELAGRPAQVAQLAAVDERSPASPTVSISVSTVPSVRAAVGGQQSLAIQEMLTAETL